MKLSLARMAGVAVALSLCGTALADTINVGWVKQVSPKPAITYVGDYGSFISSSLVQNPVSRTVVTLDIYALAQSVGITHLERIDVLDGGGNSYLGSPGADIDFFTLEGLSNASTITHSYTGTNAVHLGESSATLGSRVAGLDAITGDQDFNSLHFVSLGLNGFLSMSFSTLIEPGSSGGSGSGGSGGMGPGEYSGGGGGGTDPIFSNLIQISPGLKLHLSEAGSSEGYAIRLIGTTAVPAPAVAPVFAALLGLGRRRRR
ncbi:MAG: hypothetical protein JNM94_04660 [Phycisphaerae bacterium]|nr:hypothetical protein [Phycisphaerae bacterium]